jgi:hypothetical protein
MDIKITTEVILSQLGYSQNEHILAQADEIIKNTKGFNDFSKHLISLNDNLKHMHAYIALSNSEKYFKIKCDENDSDAIVEEFDEKVNHFSKKYHVNIRKLENKNVYYILGKD